jgi:NADP-dependent 3-hydroxy acid dehydrogenase YdfG
MSFYEKKLALITGGSSGIGLALAKEIVAKGGSVAILARHEEALDAAVNEINTVKKDQVQKVY